MAGFHSPRRLRWRADPARLEPQTAADPAGLPATAEREGLNKGLLQVTEPKLLRMLCLCLLLLLLLLPCCCCCCAAVVAVCASSFCVCCFCTQANLRTVCPRAATSISRALGWDIRANAETAAITSRNTTYHTRTSVGSYMGIRRVSSSSASVVTLSSAAPSCMITTYH